MSPRRILALVAAISLPSACGKVDNTNDDAAVDSGMVDGAGDGGGGACDPAVSPTPVDDSCGVFVDATSGNDANVPSSKASPMLTLLAALGQVPSGGAIYLCSGAAFDGGVTVPAGVRIYGGLDCATWAYDAQEPAIVAAPTDVVPLRLASGVGTTVLTDIYVQATRATAAGGSSIGIIASGTATLRRVLIVTGDGAAGVPGMTPVGQGMMGTVGNRGASGCTALNIAGGATTTLTCSSGTTTGGQGGIGAYYGYDGANGTPGPANFGTGNGMSSAGCSNGRPGATGGVGAAGTGGAGVGTIGADGYAGVAGGVGGVGDPGQGGGGGGGASSFGVCAINSYGGASGGSGGTGGCGGVGGTGGQPGGSSIGIISLNASLVFNEVSIQTGSGGGGGAGGDGQGGGEGGDGAGGGSSPYAACAGGKGGTGGLGGTGGGGTGGHALGIAYFGSAPASATVTFTLGTAGAGGGTGPAAGATGVAADTQSF